MIDCFPRLRSLIFPVDPNSEAVVDGVDLHRTLLRTDELLPVYARGNNTAFSILSPVRVLIHHNTNETANRCATRGARISQTRQRIGCVDAVLFSHVAKSGKWLQRTGDTRHPRRICRSEFNAGGAWEEGERHVRGTSSRNGAPRLLFVPSSFVLRCAPSFDSVRFCW